MSITFDENGFLSQLIDLTSATQDVYNITQEFLWYEGANNNIDLTLFTKQASGAYIFRPAPKTEAEKVFIGGTDFCPSGECVITQATGWNKIT